MFSGGTAAATAQRALPAQAACNADFRLLMVFTFPLG